MFTDQAPTITFLTPGDHDVPSQLVALIDQAQTSVRFIIYGCTLSVFYEAVLRAIARGVDVKGIFDHTQSAGAAEHAALLRFFKTADPASFRIGTSELSGQIVHLKGIWRDARIVWSGSWNFSDSATLQVNHVDIMDSSRRAVVFQSAFDELWEFITVHEPQDQWKAG
jgi:phosphatidylserine/phosphatidylglycerophosphate/cardiolipin synthase-like enzyme